MSEPHPNLVSDRGASPVAGPVTRRRIGRWVMLIGLAAGLAVLAVASLPRRPAAPPPSAAARQVVAYEPATAPAALPTGARAPTLDDPGPHPPDLIAPSSGRTPGSGAQPAPASESAPAPGEGASSADRAAQAARAAQARADLLAMRAAPMIAYAHSQTAPVSPVSAPSAANPVLAALHAEAPASGLDRLRQASNLGLARAERLSARDYRLSAGAHAACVLETALDSTTPGYVTCLMPQDVYSDTGALVVLDKGTRVLGEYRADLRSGQGRLFILWSRAVTPGGVAITLASPATDGLGRAGVSGDLDNHFWDRFGGAVMMSLVDDAGAQLQAQMAGAQTLRLPSSAGALALQSGLAIAPTLRKDPGALVSILVAQDLDFSGVYGVAPRTP